MEGIPRDKYEALDNYKDSDVFTELERAAVEYAESLTRTPANVPDELFETLRGHLNERQIVELTNAIAWENYRARFNRGFDVTSDSLA